MNHQEIKDFLNLYVRINAEIAGITETISDLKGRKKLIEKALSGQVPENFVFQSKGTFYRIEMDVEDRGVLHFEEIEFLDDGLHEMEPIAKAGPEITIETLPRDQKIMEKTLEFLKENGSETFSVILGHLFSNSDFLKWTSQDTSLNRNDRESYKVVAQCIDRLVDTGKVVRDSTTAEHLFSCVEDFKKEKDE